MKLILILLLSFSVKACQKDSVDPTPLHVAAYQHDSASALACLNSGIPIDSSYLERAGPGGSHKTVLMRAFEGAIERRVYTTLPAMVTFLCDKGAPLLSRHWCAIFVRMCKIKQIDEPDLDKSMDIMLKASEDRKHKINFLKVL